jgi:hypothetical protein
MLASADTVEFFSTNIDDFAKRFVRLSWLCACDETKNPACQQLSASAHVERLGLAQPSTPDRLASRDSFEKTAAFSF